MMMMMMIVPGKKTDNKKGDEDNTTAGKNCSKYNLRMMLKNGKYNQTQLQIHTEIHSFSSTSSPTWSLVCTRAPSSRVRTGVDGLVDVVVVVGSRINAATRLLTCDRR